MKKESTAGRCKKCEKQAVGRRRFCFDHLIEREKEKNAKKACKTCGNLFGREHRNFNYLKYCSWKCARESPEVKQKMSIGISRGFKKLKNDKRKYAEFLVKRSLNIASKVKKMSTKSRKGKLDAYFSVIVRNQKKDEAGLVSCFTCGKRDDPKKMDCGHYVSRRITSLRWHFKNAHPQCKFCNRYAHGAMDSYALKLQGKYGEDILLILSKEKEKIQKLTIEFFNQTLIELYQKAKEYGLDTDNIFRLSDRLYIANLDKLNEKS